MSSDHGAAEMGVVTLPVVAGAVLQLVMKAVMVAPHLVVGAVPVLALVIVVTLGTEGDVPFLGTVPLRGTVAVVATFQHMP